VESVCCLCSCPCVCLGVCGFLYLSLCLSISICRSLSLCDICVLLLCATSFPRYFHITCTCTYLASTLAMCYQCLHEYTHSVNFYQDCEELKEDLDEDEYESTKQETIRYRQTLHYFHNKTLHYVCTHTRTHVLKRTYTLFESAKRNDDVHLCVYA